MAVKLLDPEIYHDYIYNPNLTMLSGLILLGFWLSYEMGLFRPNCRSTTQSGKVLTEIYLYKAKNNKLAFNAAETIFNDDF